MRKPPPPKRKKKIIARISLIVALRLFVMTALPVLTATTPTRVYLFEDCCFLGIKLLKAFSRANGYLIGCGAIIKVGYGAAYSTVSLIPFINTYFGYFFCKLHKLVSLVSSPKTVSTYWE